MLQIKTCPAEIPETHFRSKLTLHILKLAVYQPSLYFIRLYARAVNAGSFSITPSSKPSRLLGIFSRGLHSTGIFVVETFIIKTLDCETSSGVYSVCLIT